MGGPEDHLPGPFDEEEILALLDSISFPHPTTIRPLKVTAAFHIIYVLACSSDDIIPKLSATTVKPTTPSVDLLLRISGDHVPSLKTENECAVLTWVRQYTSIPVPDVIRYDATTLNPLKREYMLVNRCPGVPVSDIYDTLSQTQIESLVNQLIDILEELHAHEFHAIGGLIHSSEDPRTIISGPVMDEWFWFLPDIELYFPNSTETFSSLNVSGPFPDYTSYITASVEKYIHTAEVHPSLKFVQKYFPRLQAFLAALQQQATLLNNVPIRLAHKDLHFANILCDPVSLHITAILDWEFAGTVPFPRWDPPRAFLWNGQPGDAAFKEKYRLRDRFKEICKERDVQFVKDEEFTSPLQESMHNVMNILRWFVTLTPKGGYSEENVGEWEVDFVKELEAFGV